METNNQESCLRKIYFCCGHRVMNHESKCATLHGHNGIIWIHATPIKGLDELGRVIDFSVLKERVGGWVDTYWDHTTILYEKDEKTIDLVNQAPAFKKTFVLPTNPTAENLATYLLYEVCPKVLYQKDVIVYQVDFWETENCVAKSFLKNSCDKEVLKLYGY